mgnify:CR=1 FL=1
MTVNNSRDFALLLSDRPNLISRVVHFKIFMGLVNTLNRGCKCNRNKLAEQIELSYKTVLLKKKDSEIFQEEVKELLLGNNEKSITFYHKKEKIFSFEI